MAVLSLLRRIYNFPISPAASSCLYPVISPAHREAPVRSILVIRLDEIGDLVLTIPFLRELRRNHPLSFITLVVKPAVENLLAFCPYIDELLTFDCRVSPSIAPYLLQVRAFRFAKRRLRHRSFDLAIIPRMDVDFYRATFLAFFAKATRRLAFSENATPLKSRKNKGYDVLLTDVVHPGLPCHEVETNLSLIPYLGGTVHSTSLEMWLDEADRSFAADLLPPGSLLVAIAPGAGRPYREWPIDRYISLAQWCSQTLNAKIVLVGGEDDVVLGGAICRHFRAGACLDLTGKTSLRQTSAVLERCRLLIGNDSGAKHIAAASGTPVVEISPFPKNGDPRHTMSPFRFRAWGANNIVLQPDRMVALGEETSFVMQGGILGVEVDAVCKAVADIVEG